MKESEFTKTNTRVRDVSLWDAEDEQGSEIEVSDFLYALVRLLKPQKVLETGYYTGQSTAELWRGIVVNGYGWLFACDTENPASREFLDREFIEGPRERVMVSTPGTKGIDLIKQHKEIDLLFIDSGNGEEREAELREAAGRLSRDGVIAMHDTYQPRCPNLGKICADLKLQPFYFNTPRGITLFRKQSGSLGGS